ncbi:lytic transglycosylase domain-containing protein [Dictyobacter arantiisoli]|uniref:Transglycosylase SLT domain-containing protein n=1 Tax=Dictyobacter arantiisoli TaxID=2014874 RepID=A0A5A5T9B8_9CHLR|nr:lytic transglycosylase domain-containing protein [Dictyobacter arantiisoli]GCF08091.1 hypothetical protein KDI_16550 [Dictyobacter arantiisoli]
MLPPLYQWSLCGAVFLTSGLAVLVTNRRYTPRLLRILARNLFLISIGVIMYQFVTVAMMHSVSSVPKAPPPTASNYVSIARADAIAAGIDPTLFVRQIRQESNFNPRAISQAGALGIAQFMPATARGLGIDPSNPEQALKGAARLMASYVRRYGSESAALAAYNAGPGALDGAVARCGQAWKTCLPSETQAYIAVIVG